MGFNSLSFLALIIKFKSNLLFGVQTRLFFSSSIILMRNDPPIFSWKCRQLPLFLKNQKFGNNAGKGEGGTGNLIRPPFCLFAAQIRWPPVSEWTLP